MSSKKHYAAIAAMISEEIQRTVHEQMHATTDVQRIMAGRQYDVLVRVARSIAYELQQDNTAFNRSHFLLACGVE